MQGAIQSNNSCYREGDSVPQRLFHQVKATGTHTMRLEYEFSKSNIYAYDFLANVDDTMPAGSSGLNECGNRPSFIGSSTCNTLFSQSQRLIPSDPFDAVATRENPITRSMRFGCSPSCPSRPPSPSPSPALTAAMTPARPTCRTATPIASRTAATARCRSTSASRPRPSTRRLACGLGATSLWAPAPTAGATASAPPRSREHRSI